MYDKKESMNEELDIVKEFNTILESVADDSNFNHDRYLRFAFADPKRMAELLKLYARHKPLLWEFLDTRVESTIKAAFRELPQILPQNWLSFHVRVFGCRIRH